jgi:cell division protein YceG involved in septum cleavage
MHSNVVSSVSEPGGQIPERRSMLWRSLTVLWNLLRRGCLTLLVILVVLYICVFFTFMFPIFNGGVAETNTYNIIQNSHTIAAAMVAYAYDNNGNYPDGKSSTEIFQKLLDEGYVNDSSVFYIYMAGKNQPVTGQRKLKPENVCWDVTSPVDSSSPDALPVIFLTGYKVNYAAGGSALPLAKIDPYPSWMRGIYVCYKSNKATFTKLNSPYFGTESIPTFIPPDFNANGKTYHQLTPDGVLGK